MILFLLLAHYLHISHALALYKDDPLQKGTGEYTILQEQKAHGCKDSGKPGKPGNNLEFHFPGNHETDSVTFLENKLIYDHQIIHPTKLIDFQVLKLLIELIKVAMLGAFFLYFIVNVSPNTCLLI